MIRVAVTSFTEKITICNPLASFANFSVSTYYVKKPMSII